MLEKPEGAIKNRQSRDTGNIGHTRHRTTRAHKTQDDEGTQDTGR